MTDEELRRLFGEMRQETRSAIAELRQETAELRQETRSAIGELRQDVSQLRGEMTAVRGEIIDLRGEMTAVRGEITDLRGEITDVRGEIATLRDESTAAHAETRRHFDVAVEEMKHQVQQVAESVVMLTAEVRREDAAIRDEMRRGFADTYALIRFSYWDLERRLPRSRRASSHRHR